VFSLFANKPTAAQAEERDTTMNEENTLSAFENMKLEETHLEEISGGAGGAGGSFDFSALFAGLAGVFQIGVKGSSGFSWF
jgi:alpha-D-ribose 1-methylphosphonate 5-triphosphate synthase subunit PhnG